LLLQEDAVLRSPLIAAIASFGAASFLLAVAPLASATGAARGAATAGYRLGISPVAVPPKGSVILTVNGDLSAGEEVVVQRLSGSGWHTVATGRSGARRARIAYRHTRSLGRFQLRAVIRSQAGVVAGTSNTAKLVVERHGPGNARDHAFLLRDLENAGHHPLRWNPCRAIHYRVNLHRAPRHAAADVKEALRRISQISRLHFVRDGKTKYIPQDNLRQKEPLVIAWARTQKSSWFAGERFANGVGGVWGAERPGRKNYITHGFAVIAVNGAGQRQYVPGFGAGFTNGALLLHELGHAMGLDHAKHPNEIMYPAQTGTSPAAIYGAGDYRGLQLQGRHGSCPR
jgi:hypothetical protein